MFPSERPYENYEKDTSKNEPQVAFVSSDYLTLNHKSAKQARFKNSKIEDKQNSTNMSQQKPLIRGDSNKGTSSEDEQIVIELHYKTSGCASPVDLSAIEQYPVSKPSSQLARLEKEKETPSNLE